MHVGPCAGRWCAGARADARLCGRKAITSADRSGVDGPCVSPSRGDPHATFPAPLATWRFGDPCAMAETPRPSAHAARCACRTSRRRATADAGTRRPGHRAGVRHQGRRRTRRGQRAQRVPRCRQRHRDPRRLDTGELRHTFVSLVSDSGVRVKQIACLAGHTNSRTTDLVYRQQLRPSWRKAPKPSASCSSTPHDQKVATDAHSELRTSQPSAVSVATTTGPSRRRRRPWRSGPRLLKQSLDRGGVATNGVRAGG